MNLNHSFVEKALLIDDCDTDNFIHKNFIISSKFAKEVIAKRNSSEAILYLNSLDTNAEIFPDVIFLDINMPIHNGFDFLEQFENYKDEIKNKCKIVIVSTSENPKDIDRMSKNPLVKDYIYKPLTKQELDKLRTTLQSDCNIS